jgi:hypothetical protein
VNARTVREIADDRARVIDARDVSKNGAWNVDRDVSPGGRRDRGYEKAVLDSTGVGKDPD